MLRTTLAITALAGFMPLTVQADVIEQARELPAFTKVAVSGSLDSVITAGEAQAVTIIADADRQERIETEVRNGTLYIKMKGNWRGGGSPEAVITVPTLESYALSGSGDADLRNIDADSFALRISGSGDIDAQGRCGSGAFAISGSGDIMARRLQCRDVELSISGSGDAEIYASGIMNVSVSGSGDVDAWGGGSVKRMRMSGSGDFEMHGGS